MRTLLTLALISFLAAPYARAQDAPARYNLDSLAHVLQLSVPDTSKARACFLLAEEWLDKDTLMAKKYALQGKTAGKAYPFWQGVSLLYEAKGLAPTAPDSAAKLFMQAEKQLQPFSTPEAWLYRAMCWHDYARVFHFEKDDPETYINLLLNKVVPLLQKAGDKYYLGKNYLDIAYGFKNLKEFAKAETYLKQAIATLRGEKGNTRYLASAWHTLSENNSLSGKSTEAANYMDSLRHLLEPYPDAQVWLDYYAGESMRLTIAEQFDQSLAASARGIALAQKLKQPYPEQRLLLQKFYALYNKKDLTQARDVALDLSRRQPFMNTAANRLLLFYGLMATYEDLHNTAEAYKWLKRYSHLSDSLAQSNLEAKVNALEIKFRNAEHQKKIVELNAANDQARFDLKRTRLLTWSLAIVSILLLTVILLGYFVYRNRKNAAQQKEQVKLSQAMLQGQEEERKRVARDLHDSLGGQLASLKISLSELAASNDTTNHQELNNIIRQLDHSTKELRRIAHNMMPEMLLRLGLEAALKDLCDTIASDNLAVHFKSFGIQPGLPQQEQVIIYRIAQELLSNVVKHAEATKVILQCNQRDDRFFITVEDDGRGITATTLQEKQGMGFLNIKNRVAYLNGNIDILSKTVGKGTSINIELHVTTEMQTGHPG